jgi:hypothetical protein
MPISNEMIVRIANADIAMHMAFPRSVTHWHEPNEERSWKILAGGCDPLLLGKGNAVAIDGDCSNRVSAPDGGIIHVYGDLYSTIEIAGHNEIIITGNVRPGAEILASGFCHLFVGGEFSGKLRSTGSSKIWISSDFLGAIETGNPSTELFIGGNYIGDIRPAEQAALLWLTVGGYASEKSLSRIVDYRYTQFNASIAVSDTAPGLYPTNGHLKTASGGNSFNRWCVQNKNGT